MRPTNRFLLACTGILAQPFILSPPASAAPSAETMANTCAMCHGTDGKAVGKMEKLYGKPASKIAEELFEFKRENKGRVMAPLMKAYSDEQIRMISQYFESLPRKKR
ncbi:MAG: c-type cytochrome [Hyphomicrobiaceae bacterium]